VLDPTAEELLVLARVALEPLEMVEPVPELRADSLASMSGAPFA
jgi:hypothetical protein